MRYPGILAKPDDVARDERLRADELELIGLLRELAKMIREDFDVVPR